MKPLITLGVLFVVLMLQTSTYAQSIYIPLDSAAPSIVTFDLTGGEFLTGCAEIDPTYWVSQNEDTIAVNFVSPQNNPSFRVWGMNVNDSAEVYVNSLPFPLNASSASYDEKVICSSGNGSPGPDGVAFSNGNLMGANTTANWSYQNVTLLASNVNTFKIITLGGNGWGIDGVTINYEVTSIEPESDLTNRINIYPNPTTENLFITHPTEDILRVEVLNALGQAVLIKNQINTKTFSLDLEAVPSNSYVLKIKTDSKVTVKRIVKK